MGNSAFLSGLNTLQRRFITLLHSMTEDEKHFIHAKDLLQIIALEDWGMDEESFEEECEELSCSVDDIASYPSQSIGYAYRIMLQMGLPWRMRYPYLDLIGMIGDFHDEIPFGPESVEVKLSKYSQTLLPVDKSPLLPLALLNGATLPNGSEVPAHNLEELWMAMEHIRQTPELALEDLMEVIPGPDFGPGGVVGGVEAIRALYEKGNAALTLRGKIQTEIEGGRTRVAITSLPHGILIKPVLEQIHRLSNKTYFPLYALKNMSNANISNAMDIRIVLDVSPNVSANQVKEMLYRETDLERTVHFQCAFKDKSGWSVEGPLITVLKAAVSQCTIAWKRKDKQPMTYIPFLRDVMRYGGYKNPISQLTDARRTSILSINRS